MRFDWLAARVWRFATFRYPQTIHQRAYLAMAVIKIFFSAGLLVASLVPHVAMAAQPSSTNPLTPPPAAVVQEAKKLVASMSENPRGPYTRLRWFCADGSVLPPQAYACRERGGGRQHGEYSPDRQRLQQLGWPVGTIFAAMAWEEFWDADRDQQRLRDIVLEDYLVATQGGWILKKAQHYRGRIQAEDEEAAGLNLLLQLLANTEWLQNNYLLAREVIHTVPHGAQPDLSRSIRRAAQDIAEQVNSFETIRIEIHTRPSASSAPKVSQWLEKYRQQNDPSNDLMQTAETLIEELNLLYGATGRQYRLTTLQQQLAGYSSLKPFAARLANLQTLSNSDKVAGLSALIVDIRQTLATLSPRQRLLVLDGIGDLSKEMRLLLDEMQNGKVSRQQLLQQVEWLCAAAYGEGLLSPGEYTSLRQSLTGTQATDSINTQHYLFLSQQLNLTSAWAIGTIRYTFAEALARFSALEPAAIGYVDDALRASALLPLANLSKQLAFDAQAAYGVGKYVEKQAVPNFLVLNPGLARGRLRFVSEAELAADVAFNRDDIVVLPQTLSDLSPVAGVLTLGEGNLLSHVQLLARNFGIPNIALTPKAIPALKPLEGEQVVLVAGSDGSVALWRESTLPANLLEKIAQTELPQKLSVPTVNLSVKELINLSELNRSLSGVVVGPKAANLGELNRLFPGRVAPAAAIPFGIFIDEVNRFEDTRWEQLALLYQRHRNGELDDQALQQALNKLREAVGAIKISDALQAHISAIFDKDFGADGQVGVFIRSDTNVEDLPGFTGAGLSETLPNITRREDIFAAIPRVWASVLSPRAITWRSNLLQNPEQVYPSVLLMRSVPATKSGVLITADLVLRQPGVTVSTAWGAGGAVAGEAAATRVLLNDGDERLISEAKTPYQRLLPLTGGVSWVAAPAGPVLTDSEKQQLRQLVNDVNARITPALDDDGKPMPWDIEFGFVAGELTLFQIRPLVERGQVRADRVVRQLLPANADAVPSVDLTAAPLQVTL